MTHEKRSPDVEANVYFVNPSDGGRDAPAVSGYRPHHRLRTDLLTTGEHHYLQPADVPPGGTARTLITFISPDAYPHSITPGQVLEVYEGNRLVAHAHIVRVLNSDLEAPPTNLSTVLRVLGYTRDWLALGVVSESELQGQYATFLTSRDQNAEHYRNGTFRCFLHRTKSLSDAEIAALAELRDAPEHIDLTDNRLIDLVSSEVLSDDQLRTLADHPRFDRDPVKKRHRRALILRGMRKNGLSPFVFEQIRHSADACLHESLLDHTSVSREHLLWLCESGANLGLRNRAKQMLQSKRFRAE